MKLTQNDMDCLLLETAFYQRLLIAQKILSSLDFLLRIQARFPPQFYALLGETFPPSSIKKYSDKDFKI